jgi:hypothetical protein
MSQLQDILQALSAYSSARVSTNKESPQYTQALWITLWTKAWDWL